jgi:hypothetical protein
MAVFAVEEFESSPAAPEQYEEYLDVLLDVRYMQMLPISLQTASAIIAAAPTGLVRASGVVTVTFIAPHNFIAGEKIVVSGATDATFNGTFYVDSVPSSTTLTYLQALGDTTSGNGQADPVYPEWAEVSSGREIREDVRIRDTLVRSQYFGRDYQTFLDEGLSWLRENFGSAFTDIVDNDPLIIYAKYVSAALDTLSWYLDKETTEFYLPLLQLRSRAENLAKFLGYKPTPATAGSVDLDLALTAGPYSFDIPIDVGFQFQGPSGLVFEALQQTIFSAGELSKTTQPYIQGTTIEEPFVATGAKNLQLELQSVPEGDTIAFGTVKVFVDGTEWDVVDFLSFGQNDEVEVIYGGDPPFVTFGNGIVGNTPDEGREVLVTYVTTRGRAGLLATSGTIVNPVNALVVNFQTIPIVANNTSKPSGADDPEGLDSIKANAPLYFKTADRGVTQQDVTVLASQYAGPAGNVAKARANIVRSIDDDLALRALLDALVADATTLNTALGNITTSNTAIGVARGNAETNLTTTRTAKDDIILEANSLKQHLDNAEADLETARAGLDRMGYQQLIAEGDGATSLFSNIQLDKYPVAPGSVSIVANQLVVDVSGTNGDLDVSPGVLRDTTASAFAADMVGRVVLVGNQLRQVIAYIDADNIRYSGTILTGTGVSWELYDPVPNAIDDGAGGFTGTGIVPAGSSIDYSLGIMAIQFSAAPAGSSSYGVSIIAQFAYEEQSVRSSIDAALADITSADGDADDILTEAGNIETELAAAESELSDIETEEGNISTEVTTALAVPDSLDDNIEALETYLATNLSDEGRANIILVQVLVVDGNGFYARPSQALLTEVKTELEGHNVVPTTIATVSGYRNVVAVSMKFRLKILDAFLYTEVVGRATPVVDSLFKGRVYGADLFRSYYYGLIVPNDGVGGIEGIDYADITITGTAFPDLANTDTPPSADTNGNLIITDDLVLTKGTVEFEQIT